MCVVVGVSFKSSGLCLSKRPKILQAESLDPSLKNFQSDTQAHHILELLWRSLSSFWPERSTFGTNVSRAPNHRLCKASRDLEKGMTERETAGGRLECLDKEKPFKFVGLKC